MKQKVSDKKVIIICPWCTKGKPVFLYNQGRLRRYRCSDKCGWEVFMTEKEEEDFFDKTIEDYE